MYNDFELMLSFILLRISDMKRIDPIILSRNFGRAVAQNSTGTHGEWVTRARALT